MVKTVNIKAMGADYDITLSSEIRNTVGNIVKSVLATAKILIVTDSNVEKLYLDCVQQSIQSEGIDCSVCLIPAGESSKDFKHAEHILSVMANNKMTRSDCIVALGGGVIGDLAGFVASIYLRGIPFVQIPTTLLAQVDSSVGGKVGINLAQGKNLVGSFYQPQAVIADPECLQTLNDKEFYGGMAEVIKYGAIYDIQLFNQLSSINNIRTDADTLISVIARCCEIKGIYVSEDPYDKGIRMQLNFGHTIGHAIEKQSGYGTYHHGEAVAIGMVMAAQWGEYLGITQSGTAKQLEEILKKYNLPVSVSKECVSTLYEALCLDKKNISGKLNFIFLETMGKACIVQVTTNDLYNWLKDVYI